MRSGGWIMRGIIGVGFNDRIPHLFTVLWLHQVFNLFSNSHSQRVNNS